MTKACRFDGIVTYRAPTARGGLITISLGRIIERDGTELHRSLAVQITDKEGTEVAKFGLVSETFLTFMDVLKSVMDDPIAQEYLTGASAA